LAMALTGISGCLSPVGPDRPKGTPAPNFVASSHLGERMSLAELTAEGPAVLVFYRGFW
jgi:peroxiredoxin